MPEFINHARKGKLSRTATEDSLIQRTIEFIWQSLEPWRNDPDRPHNNSEEEINASFHNFLQSRAQHDFSMVFFQHEQKQEGQRRVDLSAKPVDRTVIEGVTYTKYTPLIVIEGKRLPAPEKSRELEYVTGGAKTSGGIQRFKLGLHGKNHERVIIIGYIQQGNPHTWVMTINSWLAELSKSDPENWTKSEQLNNLEPTESGHSASSISYHPRAEGCRTQSIKIDHFWVDLCDNKHDITPAITKMRI